MEYFDPLYGPRELTRKFNPNHDDIGRFATTDGDGSGGVGGRDDKATADRYVAVGLKPDGKPHFTEGFAPTKLGAAQEARLQEIKGHIASLDPKDDRHRPVIAALAREQAFIENARPKDKNKDEAGVRQARVDELSARLQEVNKNLDPNARLPEHQKLVAIMMERDAINTEIDKHIAEAKAAGHGLVVVRSLEDGGIVNIKPKPTDSLDDPKAKPLTPEARDARLKELNGKVKGNINAINDKPSLRDDKNFMAAAMDVISERNALEKAKAFPNKPVPSDHFLFRSATELEEMRKDVANQMDAMGMADREGEKWKALNHRMDVLHGDIEARNNAKNPNTMKEYDSQGRMVTDSMSKDTSLTHNSTLTPSSDDSTYHSGETNNTAENTAGDWNPEGNKPNKDQMSFIGDDFKKKSPHEPTDPSAEEDKLLHASVTHTLVLSTGGASGDSSSKVKLLTLKDGSQAIFKPESGEHGGIHEEISDGFPVQREVSAWNVAKIVGMADMVAPVVPRTIRGNLGSMAMFEDGTVAKNADWGQKEYGKDPGTLAKAALFDYVIGNMDRHGGNWLLRDDGGLMLIDHNLTFPDKPLADNKLPFWRSNHKLIGEAIRRSRTGANEKIAPLHDYIAPYVEHEGEIIGMLKKSGLPEGSVTGVASRIKNLSHANWKDMTTQ